MSTAVDTNIFLDVLATESERQDAALNILAATRRRGSLVICEIVYSELAAAFRGNGARLDAFLAAAGVRLLPSSRESLIEAGKQWRIYRTRGGNRSRILPDFLVGCHAYLQADALLTRDRGFYRTSFKGLRILEP